MYRGITYGFVFRLHKIEITARKASIVHRFKDMDVKIFEVADKKSNKKHSGCLFWMIDQYIDLMRLS